MTLDDIKKDKRYTQTLEWCGVSSYMWVARFCEEYIGNYASKEEAL